MAGNSKVKKRKFIFRRWIDRKLTANVWAQLGLFSAVFLLSMGLLILLYSFAHVGDGFLSRIPITLSDVFGADRFIQYAYGEVDSNVGVKVVTVIACVVGAVIFQGLLVATLTNIFQSRADKVRLGEISYNFKNHVLILGYNRQTPALIKQLEKYEDIVVAVENDIEEVNEKLEVLLDNVVWKKITLIHANRTSEEDLERLSVDKASRVYIVGEDEETEHDERNMESYELLFKRLNENIPECYVNIKNSTFFTTLKSYKGTENEVRYDKFHPYNYYELWTRRILAGDDYYQSLDYRDEENNLYRQSDRFVHLAIVGWSEMGEALASMTALLAHYPNYVEQPGHPRTRISILDSQACKAANEFVGLHPTLFEHCNYSIVFVNEKGEREIVERTVAPEKDFLGVEFEFVQVPVPGAQLHSFLTEWNCDEKQMLTIAFCSYDETVNSSLSYTLPMSIYENNTPIWIYQKQKLPDVFTKQSIFDSLRVFGGDEIAIDFESEEIAWAKCLNYFYRKGLDVGNTSYEEKDVEAEWSKASIQDRWSSIYNVCSFRYKLRSVGIFEKKECELIGIPEECVEVLAEAEHNRWNMEKLMFGFRSATQAEYENCIECLKKGNRKVKDDLKQRFIHPDIRRFQDLGTDHNQNNIADYDRTLVAEMLNIMKSQDAQKFEA